MDNPTEQPQAEPQFIVNEALVQERINTLKQEQNLPLGIIGGALGGFIGAVLWAAITYFTEYQIGLLAVLIGFLVGFGVSRLGKGIDTIYGIIGAVIALFSILLGNFLASIGFLARGVGREYFDVLTHFKYEMIFELLAETFSIIDLVFYGIAIYEGYKFSFRKISREQLLEGAVTQVNPQ